MTSTAARAISLRRSLVAVATALAAVVGPRVDAQEEVRALWVVRTALTSPVAIDEMVTSARDAGFNTLLVQVRGRADAYYSGGIEPRPSPLALQPSFDPLAEVVALGHQAGLRVHAWVNVNLVAGAGELPTAGDHIVYLHPEWLMVPRDLAEELAAMNPRSPEYLERLALYVRSQPAELEGLYLSPLTPAAADYTAGIIRHILKRYPIDGLHLDYVRYPREDFDYSRAALSAFRQDVVEDLLPGDRDGYDERLPSEPFVYTQAFPERWRLFRTSKLTALVMKVQQAVKSVRPSAILSAAVVPDADDAILHRLQDWRGWLQRDLLDAVCPMAYTTDAVLFASQVAAARAIAGPKPLWAGIGAYRLSPLQIAAHVLAARRLGADGVVLFSYDSLTEPARGSEYLSRVGRAAFLQ